MQIRAIGRLVKDAQPGDRFFFYCKCRFPKLRTVHTL